MRRSIPVLIVLLLAVCAAFAVAPAENPQAPPAAVCTPPTCDKGSCDKPACEKAKCAPAACEKGPCDKAACEKGACDKAACENGACDKCPCDKAACETGACEKVTCDKANCEKAAQTPCDDKDCRGAAKEKIALLKQKQAELEQLQREIRQLQIETGGHQQQILVRVQILEISLTKMRRMGFEIADVSSGYIKADDLVGLMKVTNKLGNNPTDKPVKEASCNGALCMLDWLEENGIAKVLTRPTMITMSGRPAHLMVGDEIPMLKNTDSKADVGFQSVGTQLDILPVVLGNKNVRIEVRARLSNADYSDGLEVNGVRLPKINVRQCDTAIETSFGKSVVLTGGVVEKRHTTTKVKETGRVPEEINEIATMLVVTPELVEGPPTVPATAQRAHYVEPF
jgi:type II/III secretion system protein